MTAGDLVPGDGGEPPLWAAAGAALVDLADADPRLVAVVGTDPGPAGRLVAQRPDRIVRAPGGASRVWVGAGLAAAGRRVVTVQCDEALRLPAGGAGGWAQVLLVASAADAAAASAAGSTVVQPGWADDTRPLLRGALEAGVPVALRLHDVAVDALPDRPVGQPLFGAPRLLRRGYGVTLAASGWVVPLLSRVVRLLAQRGIEATAVELHTLPPATGLGPAEVDGVLLIGSADAADRLQSRGPGTVPLDAIPVGDGSPRTLMNAVAAHARTR